MDWLKEIKADEKIRDPLYGYIWLTKEEKEIIDTPLFQRLRRIHQLALTKYVYPAAEHSRFVHSLGTMHCATQMLTGIWKHRHTKLKDDSVDKGTHLKRLRFAALLHDIGHTAFSHAAENLILQPLSHEAMGQYIIEKYAPIANILDEHTPFVKMLLSSRVTDKYKLLHQIISGQLDADRADYLMRDSYACGVKYGEYDMTRYLQAFAASDEDGALRFFVDEGDIFVVESFLMARHHYNMQVPYHRTRMGFDFVLEKFLCSRKDDLPDFELQHNHKEVFTHVNLNRFETFDDYSVFELIKKHAGEKKNQWAKMLLRGGHLCPVYDATGKVDEQGKTYKNVVKELEEKGWQENEDFFARKKTLEFSRLVSSDEVEDEDGKEKKTVQEEIFVRIKNREKFIPVSRYSTIIANAKPVTLYRIYTTEKRKQEAQDIVQTLCKKFEGECP